MLSEQCNATRSCACSPCRARKLRHACDLVFVLAKTTTGDDADALTTLIGVGRFHAATLDGGR